MCIYIYICIHIYQFIYIYIYVSVNIYTHVCFSLFACVCPYSQPYTLNPQQGLPLGRKDYYELRAGGKEHFDLKAAEAGSFLGMKR